MDTIEYENFCAELCRVSAEVIMPFFRRSDLAVELKSDQSPVTIADRKAEEVLRERIAKHFPQHGVIGEEYGSYNEGADFVWYLDPIDGTKSFVHGCPLFGTLICLAKDGVPLLGAIHHPALNLTCIGTSTATRVNGRQVWVRKVKNLAEACLLTSDLGMIFEYQNRDRFLDLASKVKLFRTWGDCFGYTLMAEGFADIMVDPIMNPWDLLPLIPIINGAGGKITAWDGTQATRGSSIIAASAGLHDQVLEILNT